VPTALGVNPSKTIAALAERGVEQLLVVRGQ
jgi:choline dehydrogenase-like flavoprotein